MVNDPWLFYQRAKAREQNRFLAPADILAELELLSIIKTPSIGPTGLMEGVLVYALYSSQHPCDQRSHLIQHTELVDEGQQAVAEEAVVAALVVSERGDGLMDALLAL